jgi:hypothetical protein
MIVGMMQGALPSIANQAAQTGATSMSGAASGGLISSLGQSAIKGGKYAASNMGDSALGGVSGAIGSAIADKIQSPGERYKSFMDDAFPGSSMMQRLNNGGGGAGAGFQSDNLRAQMAMKKMDNATTLASTKMVTDTQKAVARIQTGDSPKAEAEIAKITAEIETLSAEKQLKFQQSLTEAVKRIGEGLHNQWQDYENRIQAVRAWNRFLVVAKETSVSVTTMIDNYLKGSQMKEDYTPPVSEKPWENPSLGEKLNPFSEHNKYYNNQLFIKAWEFYKDLLYNLGTGAESIGNKFKGE